MEHLLAVLSLIQLNTDIYFLFVSKYIRIIVLVRSSSHNASPPTSGFVNYNSSLCFIGI